MRRELGFPPTPLLLDFWSMMMLMTIAASSISASAWHSRASASKSR